MRAIVFLLHRKKVIAGGDVPEILKGLFSCRELRYEEQTFLGGAGDVLLDSSLIPSLPIMPQDRARVDGP